MLGAVFASASLDRALCPAEMDDGVVAQIVGRAVEELHGHGGDVDADARLLDCLDGEGADTRDGARLAGAGCAIGEPLTRISPMPVPLALRTASPSDWRVTLAFASMLRNSRIPANPALSITLRVYPVADLLSRCTPFTAE